MGMGVNVYLEISAEKCTGCRICENFCSFHHEGAVWPERSRITIVAQSDEGPFVPNVCRQCGVLSPSKGEDAPCAAACPVEVITLNERTGAWVVDVEECIGCGACVEACPYGAIFVDEELGVPLKCDLCGGEPECAVMCPSGAIRVSRVT
jgi:carbon-monoxide dehydrogenase iron sulfur subunit